MSETAIRAIRLTKQFTIGHSHPGSFKELLMSGITRSRRPDAHGIKTIRAIDDLSFEVRKGEALGIIGRNGAGKSTLLKILSGITKPTSGQIEIYGRMSSILDIGVGFHPELTGRENIYLSGQINGLGRKEIRKRMDEIIDFSGVEKFIDTPVKYYSSGMFVRLAFSVFSNIDSEILLLDEVMSVGDAAFQMKSAKKLQSIFSQGKTIVLVSHNPIDIMKLCSRAIVLEDGRITEEGAPARILAGYAEESILETIDYPEQETTPGPAEVEEKKEEEKPPRLRTAASWENLSEAPGNPFFRLKKVEIRAENGTPGDEMTRHDSLVFEITYWRSEEPSVIDIGFTLNQFRNIIFGSTTIFEMNSGIMQKEGLVTARAFIPPLFLNNTIYSIDLYGIRERKDIFFQLTDLLHFVIREPAKDPDRGEDDHYPDYPGMVRPKLDWQVDICSGEIPKNERQN